jgi:streptomycin 6-kinase
MAGMDPVTIPDAFAARMVEMSQEAGKAWLQGLPDLLAACQQRWSLRLLPLSHQLSYNYIVPALLADGTPVILKAGVPRPELSREIEALRAYGGSGSVMLLEADAEQGVLLLERLLPGQPLTEVADDARATSIAAQVMRRLWRPLAPGHGFKPASQWALGLGRLHARFHGGTGPLAPALVARAEALFEELLPSQAEPVLLHGDLHHENILSAQRRPWLAIDPKGVAGEPAYEVGAWLRNPMPQLMAWPDLDGILARRIDQLAEELELDRQRLLGWGLAQAVLSAWWSLEDHGHGWEASMQVAEILAQLGA